MADPIPFSQTMPIEKDTKARQTTIIAELKSKAIHQWVLRFVGPKRYIAFEPYIKTDVSDRFVINYSLGKLASDKKNWELVGKLDNDGLKRWVRVTEARLGQGAAPKPVLVVTIENEALSLNKVGTQWIEGPLGKVMARFNSRIVLSTTGHPNLILPAPPRSPNEVESYGERLRTEGMGSAAWVHLSRPEGSNGQMEILYIGGAPARIAFTQAYLFPFTFEGTPSKRLEMFVEEKMPSFSSSLEDLIASGTLVSTTFRLRVTGLDSFAKYRKVDQAIGLLDPVTRVMLRSAEPQTVEYEISSTLPLAEFALRIPSFHIGEFGLKTETQDANSLSVRLVPVG
ncbi:MAG: hypothetical protein HYR96_13250 [Deltaproteobacteria bacterium]|nr:hypothetical protein [Deltaproteobacteria bacterium]MBI3295034.1 hypothetical protein [Deltaproteobacteria bacterium]